MNLNTIFSELHAVSRANPLSVAQRRLALEALAAGLLREQAAFCEAIDADFGGRAKDETLLLEIAPSIQNIKHAIKALSKWAAPRKAKTNINFLPAKNKVVPQPLGVVGIVVPWNYPIFIAVSPLVSALAAGNRVMMKMSEHTPLTSALFAKLIHEILPADVCQVINGGVDVAQAFTALPFDHLLFTGSTPVGYSVMQAAAKNLTPVTLELGGKSPALVGQTANLELAARRIAVGKWRNAGQTCIAPDYVLVHKSQAERFTDLVSRFAASHYPDALNNPNYTSIINARQFERLHAWLNEALEKGAVAAGEVTLDAARKRMAPVILNQVSEQTKLMQDEIFGPILPIIPYETLDEAITYINAKPRPLSLYVFDTRQPEIDEVLSRCVAGGVCVNDTIFHIAQDSLPFGGVGASGMGHYHGQWGFDTFSKLMPVMQLGRFSFLGLLDPPHQPIFYKVLKRLMKF